MHHTSHLIALALSLGLGLLACDPEVHGPAAETVVLIDELDLAVETELEQTGKDFECVSRSAPDWLIEDGQHASEAEFCAEWNAVDALALPPPDPLAGVCNYWTEGKGIVSGVKCSASGSWTVFYRRDCSQCVPNPVSCSGWYWVETVCSKG